MRARRGNAGQGEGIVPSAPLFAALEAGGTKMNCAIGRGHDAILARARVATTKPDETLARIIGFFESEAASHGKPVA
ncbi:MAG: ROK family protein, partial [Alphaproteobacteria bacterium]